MLKSFAHGTVMPGLNETMLGRLIIDLRDTSEQENIVHSFHIVNQTGRALRAHSDNFFELKKTTLNYVLLNREENL